MDNPIEHCSALWAQGWAPSSPLRGLLGATVDDASFGTCEGGLPHASSRYPQACQRLVWLPEPGARYVRSREPVGAGNASPSPAQVTVVCSRHEVSCLDRFPAHPTHDPSPSSALTCLAGCLSGATREAAGVNEAFAGCFWLRDSIALLARRTPTPSHLRNPLAATPPPRLPSHGT